ncbi:MAG: hypothetical protein ACLGI6_18975, partial [Gammaproteobacteria bacterium]
MSTLSISLTVAGALALAWLAFVVVRLGFPQRLAVLMRLPADLSGALEQASARYGDAVLVELQAPIAWDRAGRPGWSARQILAQCQQLAGSWAHLGLGHGERLAIYKANDFDLFLCSAA